MNTKIAAIAVLLLAGSAPAALAQEQGDHHHERPDQSGGERTPHDVGGRPAEQHMFRPQAQPQPAPQARVAPPQAQPQAGGERWHGGGGGGAPGAERPGGWRHGGPNNFNGGGAPQPQAQAQPQRDWRGDHGDRGAWGGGDHRPQVDSWRGDHRNAGGDRSGYRGGEPGRWSGGDHRDGDSRQWQGRNDGDHRGWTGGDRDGHHGGPGADHPRWTPGRYPHAYNSGHRYHWRPYYAPAGFYAHSWAYGEILPQAWFSPDYVIEDWWDFGLPEPPYGYDWVRVGDDALLVDEYSGRIMQVVRALFW
jgi:Ni/Co efflux regulator RcnB